MSVGAVPKMDRILSISQSSKVTQFLNMSSLGQTLILHNSSSMLGGLGTIGIMQSRLTKHISQPVALFLIKIWASEESPGQLISLMPSTGIS